MTRLVIDGYNLIPLVASRKGSAPESLEGARGELLALLRDYRGRLSPPPPITVVFDGQVGVGSSREGQTSGVEVRFSRNEKADDLILRLLRGEKRGSILVTSDRDLAQAARGLAEMVLRSDEFAARLFARTAGTPPGEIPDRDGEEEVRPRSTRKKGNPRRLPKRERLRQRRLRKL